MLAELLERNQRHVDALAPDHFDHVHDGQSPKVVTLSCSDSRVPAEGMWAIDEPGWAFTVEVIGNHTTSVVDGRRVVAGSVLFPLTVLGVRTIAVVGHTGCGAVAAAYDVVETGTWPVGLGIRERIEPLVEAMRDRIDHEKARGLKGLGDRLVEHNVHDQVAYLIGTDEVPAGTQVLGFVYDLHGSYGGSRGRAVLVNVDGERDVEAIRDQLPGQHRGAVATLL